MYHLFIIVSVVMFGGCFALKDQYRKRRGSGLKISMEASCIGSVAGFVVMTVFKGFSIELTAFTLIMALWKALNGILFTFCSFKALDRINLSLFSLYTMLGGMILPFFQGILFYEEEITWAKTVCVVFVVAALLLTVKTGGKSGGGLYYAGIFILNGMSGVISKIYTSSTLPKASAAGYSLWCSVMTVTLASITLWIIATRTKRAAIATGEATVSPDKKHYFQSVGIVAASGSINTFANFLLVLALLHVDASVQYPMVTGGTMIVSTLISCFGRKKPSARELVSIALAFVGMLSLFFIPI